MWKWTKTEYKVLSLFANFSKRSEVLNSFKNELPALDELRGKLDGCRQMVEAVYNVLAKREVRYSLEEYDSSQDSQWIRTPAEILDSKSQGTCLDLAVLFCGMCLRYELIPLLIVSGNHAWVAVSLTHWLHECKASDREGKKLFKDGLLTDEEKVAELCNLVEDEEAYIAIECTGFTQGSLSKSFAQAEQEGLNRLRNFSSQNGRFILDIPIANEFYWHDLCKKRLKKETPKRFINNPLTSGENPLRELYVPLGLIERKPDAQRRPRENASPPEASPFNQPDDQYEVVQKYDGEAFLEQVLKHERSRSQGKRLAIVGDPGGGKTTLLQRIAYWILEERRGFPIWIPLASVYEEWERKDEGWLYHYLSKEWLKNTAGEPGKTPIELQHLFAELLKSGQVWLLLDGANEMALKSPLMRIKEQLAKGWADSVKVVLNCRLNLWEVEKEALWETFDIYRTLDFSYPDQVHEFINKRFGEDNPAAKRLQDKLAEENRKRLQDLVENPLRLALLCRIWKRGLATLPETKADFYRLLVKDHYQWKNDNTNKVFTITENQKKELNQVLGQLARGAIDRDNFRFRLRESDIINHGLGEPDDEGSLFWWALKLGWLLHVGFPTEGERNLGEKIYAFFHPTFQEYFASTVDDNYDFFLPLEHRDRPIIDKDNQGKYKRYRIFERQWKEVILLWLGRPEREVSDKQKEDFIRALVEFEDGCWYFYRHHAYLLAAAGIAEFRGYRCDEIVGRIVDWSFCSNYIHPVNVKGAKYHGFFPARETPENLQQWIKSGYYKSVPSMASARKVLKETERETAIALLANLLGQKDVAYTEEVALILGQIDSSNKEARDFFIERIQSNWYYQDRLSSASKLAQIDPETKELCNVLIEIIQDIPYGDVILQAAEILGKVDRGNTAAIQILVDRIEQYKGHEYTLWISATSLGKIQPRHPRAIETLIKMIQTTKKYYLNKNGITFSFYQSMGGMDSEGFCWLENRCYLSARSLGEIDPNNDFAIQTLVQMLDSSKDEFIQNDDIRCQVALSLGKISSVHKKIAITALAKLIRNTEDDELCSEAIINLGEIGIGDEEAKRVLIEYIEQGRESIKVAAVSLGKIHPGNPVAIDTLLRLILNGEDEDEIVANNLTSILQVANSSKSIWQDDQCMKVISALKHYMTDQVYEDNFFFYSACHNVIWHCTQNMTYPDFYEAWHPPEEVGNTTTLNSQSLNQAD